MDPQRFFYLVALPVKIGEERMRCTLISMVDFWIFHSWSMDRECLTVRTPGECCAVVEVYQMSVYMISWRTEKSSPELWAISMPTRSQH